MCWQCWPHARHHQQGTIAHAQGDLKGAMDAFRRATDAQPDFAYAYYRLGFVMEEARRRAADLNVERQQHAVSIEEARLQAEAAASPRGLLAT